MLQFSLIATGTLSFDFKYTILPQSTFTIIIIHIYLKITNFFSSGDVK